MDELIQHGVEQDSNVTIRCPDCRGIILRCSRTLRGRLSDVEKLIDYYRRCRDDEKDQRVRDAFGEYVTEFLEKLQALRSQAESSGSEME